MINRIHSWMLKYRRETQKNAKNYIENLETQIVICLSNCLKPNPCYECNVYIYIIPLMAFIYIYITSEQKTAKNHIEELIKYL